MQLQISWRIDTITADLSYFFLKMYYVDIPHNHLNERIIESTHKLSFYKETLKAALYYQSHSFVFGAMIKLMCCIFSHQEVTLMAVIHKQTIDSTAYSANQN